MASTQKPGTDPGKKPNDGDLPNIEVPQAATTVENKPGFKPPLPVEVIDFDNEKLKVGWQKIIESQRKRIETDVLKITPPRAKLDPIATAALTKLRAELIKDYSSPTSAFKTPTPAGVESFVRGLITEKGLATEVKKVTDRLNARRITDGRRWVLTTTYVFLLARLFHERGRELEKLMKDDLSVAETIMLDLEAKGGPVDIFTKLIVKSVMERNRINPSNTLLELVSQQVRAGI
jgi:hypothetical protein